MQPTNTNDNHTGLRATITAGTKYHTVDENNVLSSEFVLDHNADARTMFLEKEWEVYFVPEFDTHVFIRPDDYAQKS